MNIIIGFFSGIVMVAPIGPVTITLLGLGSERGRRVALTGAGGVVAADLIIVPMAVLSAGLVTSLSVNTLRNIEIFLGVLLLSMALFGFFRTEDTRRAVSGIRKPGTTLMAIGLFNPMALATWAGVILALPDSIRSNGVLPFAMGAVLASAVWHSGLALLAGSIGTRLNEAGRQRLIKASSLFLGGVAIALLAS
jgi:arginine exporter protein ArgO